MKHSATIIQNILSSGATNQYVHSPLDKRFREGYKLMAMHRLSTEQVSKLLCSNLTISQICNYLPYYKQGVDIQTFKNRYPEYFI